MVPYRGGALQGHDHCIRYPHSATLHLHTFFNCLIYDMEMTIIVVDIVMFRDSYITVYLRVFLLRC